MKYDVCHASKDFIRESGFLIDSLIYSETKAMKNSGNDPVFHIFCTMVLPLFKVGEEMTESLLFLSSYEPIIAIAENALDELSAARKGLTEAKKNNDFGCLDDEKEMFAEKSKKILERLFDDLASSDISERLCCDYIRYMICILEGAVRLCGCASEHEKNDDILILERSVETGCRNLIHQMKGLLSLVK